jgi:hypothetical protein
MAWPEEKSLKCSPCPSFWISGRKIEVQIDDFAASGGRKVVFGDLGLIEQSLLRIGSIG